MGPKGVFPKGSEGVPCPKELTALGELVGIRTCRRDHTKRHLTLRQNFFGLLGIALLETTP